MGWYETISEGVFLMLCAAFELDPDSNDAAERFAPAYLENAVTPQARRDHDVCYYAVSEAQNLTNYDYQMQTTRNSITTLKETIPASVLLTFYGPTADNDAEKFRTMFQWDSGADSPRAVLRKMRIVPIGTPSRLTSFDEHEGTYKRRRADVRVDLAYLNIEQHEVATVTEPPEIAVNVTYAKI